MERYHDIAICIRDGRPIVIKTARTRECQYYLQRARDIHLFDVTVEKTDSTITIRGWWQRYVWYSGSDVGVANDATADEILQHCYPQLVEVVERPTLINRLLALIPGNEWRKEHRTVAKVARGWHREKKREFMCYEFPRGSVVFKHSTAEVAIG